MNTEPTPRVGKSKVTLFSLTVGFVIDGTEHRLHLCTRNYPNNSFEENKNTLVFKATDVLDEHFEDPNNCLANDVFGRLWKDGHHAVFDIEVTLVKQGVDITIKEKSIRLSHLKTRSRPHFSVPPEFVDQELVTPFLVGKVLTGVAETLTNGG